MKLIRASTIVLVLASLMQVSPPSNNSETIMQLERDWSAAYLRHNIRAIARILADDYVGTDGRGVMSTKTDELREALPVNEQAAAPSFIIRSEAFSDVRVRLFGNTAILTSRNDVKANADDREVALVYRRTTVWVKRDGRWQCVSFHASRVQAEK